MPGIKTIRITETEIKSIIYSLKAKSSLCYDRMTNNILKVRAPLISHPSTHICTHSLFTGIFPDHLKISAVKPMYKKGGKTNMSNYRPIPMLTTFSEVHEMLFTIGYVKKKRKNSN
jgi:hypothetical protein